MNNTEIGAGERARLHDAILAELANQGLEGIRLDHVLERAGVSAADFASNYEGVEDCLAEAYASLTGRLDRVVREACRAAGADGDWAARVRAGIGALLDELAGDPVRAMALVHSFPASGQRAQARFQAFVESFAPLLEGGRAAAGLDAELPGEVETLAVGAVEAIVFEEVVSGRAAGLRDLAPAVTFSVLVPFIGPSRAGAAMHGGDA